MSNANKLTMAFRGSSLFLVLMGWYTLRKHLSQHPNNERKLKQGSTSIIRLGPPSTPPVNLASSKITGQNDIDSLLEQGSISETARPLRLYDTTQIAEFHAAGGAGKLILPQHLDPTSSGFIPGRLLYGPPIPEPSSADKKGKGKERQSASKLTNSRQPIKRRSLFSEKLGQDSNPHSNSNSQTSVGFSVTVPRKPLPALPIRTTDTVILPLVSSSYTPPLPQQTSIIRQHHSYSDTWERPMDGFQGNFERTGFLLPPPIPPKHPLRRISSAPPGSLDLHPVPSVPPGIGKKADIHLSKQTGNEPAINTGAASARTTGSGPNVGVSLVPHMPRKSSNLTLSFTPAGLDTSGVDRGCEDQQFSAQSEENSWERGVEELHRTGYDFQIQSSDPDSVGLPLVIPSDILPKPVDPMTTTSEEPNRGPVRHQDTFSSEESDESMGLDPEKMELAEEGAAANQQATNTTANPQPQRAQEMAEVPESPSLTLPSRGLAHMRSVSSPMPVPIPSAHPVLQLSHGVVTGATFTPQPYQSTMNSRNTVVSNTSFNQQRYMTVTPLTTTKELLPSPKLPPLNIAAPPFNSGDSGNLELVPATPRSLRGPITDLKTQCVGHFTVSPTGEVEMSTQIPIAGSSPYSGNIESISSTHFKVDSEGSHSTDRPNTSALPDYTRRVEGRGSSLELPKRLPITRKKSKSGPPGTTVRFELSRNEVFDARTWGTNSSTESPMSYQKE